SPTGLTTDLVVVSQRHFRIPFQTELEKRPQVKQIILYCSTDGGLTWQQAAAVTPSARSFDFTAPEDGDYWFKVSCVDEQGHATDPINFGSSPSLKVRVETQKQ